MDKKSKVLLWVFGLLIVGSVGVTFWRIMIKKDYVIEAQTDCDPYESNCFVWECDPESTVEGEACTGDPEADIWYFAVAKRNASNIPLCNPDADENCDPWTCAEGEKDCSEDFCDESNMEAQFAVSCNDPVQYALDNPVEEEAVECEEDDKECLAAQAEEATCEEGDEECLATQAEEVTCDPEQDPTCVVEEAATEVGSESDATETSATESVTPIVSDTSAGKQL